MANISEKGIGYFDPYVHNIATGQVTVSDRPAILKGIHVNTVMSAHSLVIKDGSTSRYTIPAGSPAGYREFFPNVRFHTIVAAPSSTAATGNVTYEFEQIP